jgi:hypothetical protein
MSMEATRMEHTLAAILSTLTVDKVRESPSATGTRDEQTREVTRMDSRHLPGNQSSEQIAQRLSD